MNRRTALKSLGSLATFLAGLPFVGRVVASSPQRKPDWRGETTVAIDPARPEAMIVYRQARHVMYVEFDEPMMIGTPLCVDESGRLKESATGWELIVARVEMVDCDNPRRAMVRLL